MKLAELVEEAGFPPGVWNVVNGGRTVVNGLLDHPGITGITTRIRESGGYRVFDKDQPIIGAFRCLKKNEVLGILPDQNESDGVFVDYFGRPAATATGPAVLSLRSGAPMVPFFAHRLPDGRYLARAYPRIEFEPSGDEERDIRDLTALFTAAIEREVRQHPTQWLWLHDRWKSAHVGGVSDPDSRVGGISNPDSASETPPTTDAPHEQYAQPHTHRETERDRRRVDGDAGREGSAPGVSQ